MVLDGVRYRAFRTGLVLIFLALCQGHAVVQMDGNVPIVINSPNGSPGEPDQYIIGYASSVILSVPHETVYVGLSNSFIDLTLRNSAFYRTGAVYIGYGAVQSNSVTVTGSETHWESVSNFYVGYKGSEGSLRIVDGGRVSFGSESVSDFAVGYDTVSTGNSVVVTGSGSTLSGEVGLRIGVAGNSNSLRIEDAGEVECTVFALGWDSSGNRNSMALRGRGSLLKNSDAGVSYVGKMGGENSLLIEDGGKVILTGDMIVGSGSPSVNSSGNSISITGDGSSMEVSGRLSIGGFGSDNFLSINDRAVVSTSFGSIGIAGNYNKATITGYGSVWDNSEDLVIGEDGSENSVTVRGGALIKLGASLLINQGEGTGNHLRLDGGFFAWAGDQADAVHAFLEDEVIQVWNGAAWESAVVGGNLAISYFLTDEEAFAFTGYHHLGGYTILTSYAEAIPEPTTFGFVAGASLAAAFHRRKRFFKRTA